MGRIRSAAHRGLGADHVADKRRLLAALRDGDPCWRCGQPMYRSQALERDHVIDRALGGVNGPAVLAHASCNRSAGARLGNQMRQFKPAGADSDITCKTCGKPYHYTARTCEICSAHYHPAYGAQRTCSRACGIALRRQVYGHAGMGPDPGTAERQAQRQAQRQQERQAAAGARMAARVDRARHLRALRATGMTWADIAVAAGLSGPGAAKNAAYPEQYSEYLRRWKSAG